MCFFLPKMIASPNQRLLRPVIEEPKGLYSVNLFQMRRFGVMLDKISGRRAD
jgi:hypothetical protein